MKLLTLRWQARLTISLHSINRTAVVNGLIINVLNKLRMLGVNLQVRN